MLPDGDFQMKITDRAGYYRRNCTILLYIRFHHVKLKNKNTNHFTMPNLSMIVFPIFEFFYFKQNSLSVWGCYWTMIHRSTANSIAMKVKRSKCKNKFIIILIYRAPNMTREFMQSDAFSMLKVCCVFYKLE